MKIAFSSLALPKSGALAVTVAAGAKLGSFGAELDERTGGLLGRSMKAARFSGKADETLTVLAPNGVEISRIVLVGIGNPADATQLTAGNAGASVVAGLLTSGETELSIASDAHEGLAVPAAEFAAELAFGALARGWRFDRYKTKTPEEKKPTLTRITLLAGEAKAAKKAWERLEKVADGVFLAREVVSEPPNVLYPESFAERCAALRDLGLEVDVLDEKRMRKLGMGALLGVGQGSAKPPRLVVMRWNGGKPGDQPIAFIGKGVTFDTGGISLKPGLNMDDMKWDMAGAGAVYGLMEIGRAHV